MVFFVRIIIFSAFSQVLGITGKIVKDYCVVGAGPAGLQMGYFLQSAGRDYIIFERSNISGNFFSLYPRHRKLISINKRYTGKHNREFNLRHDWNSLLSNDESLLFRHYSNEFFPHADSMVKYLNDFQSKLQLNVYYNVDISNIRTVPNIQEDSKSSKSYSSNSTNNPHQFLLDDQHGNTYKCRTLIIATGLWKPNAPIFKGSEYANGYEDISTDPKDYEGKSILILGHGNAAFETAASMYGVTNVVHLLARSRVRLSWNTHYVGDVRGVNNELLDSYQLKSLDGLLESPVELLELSKEDEKIIVMHDDSQHDWEPDNFPLRESYDMVIRCLGFRFNSTIFSSSLLPSVEFDRALKYPKITHNYEAISVPGLFFAGTATHSLDFRRSAGGFIHGFRYTVQVLHRILEYQNHGVPWPSFKQPITNLLNTILKRINEVSSLYQMFGTLGDVIAIQKDGLEFEYFKDFPIHNLHLFPEITGHQIDRVIVVILEYGKDFSGPDKDTFRLNRATCDPLDAHNSNFLHPVFYYYDSLPTEKDVKEKIHILPRPTRIHHILEDFLTIWMAQTSHILPLRRFLENCVGHDLRNFMFDSCFRMAMMHTSVPLNCERWFMNGQGLVAASALMLGL